MAQASVIVCNGIASELGNNNLVLMGAFDAFTSATFPVRASFYALAKIWGIGSTHATAVLKLVEQESGKVVAEAGGHDIAAGRTVHTAISRFENVTIPKSGLYEVRCYLGDQVIGSYPLQAGGRKA